MPVPRTPPDENPPHQRTTFCLDVPVGGFIPGVVDTDHVFWELKASSVWCSFWGNPDAQSREAGGLWAWVAPRFSAPRALGPVPGQAQSCVQLHPQPGCPFTTQTLLPQIARRW